MPKAGPLKQILRVLNVNELKSIRKRFCPRVSPYSDQDGKSDFINSIRDSLKRSLEHNDVTYGDIMEFLKEEFKNDKPKWITTRIRNVLNDVKISRNVGWKSSSAVRERWISSEIFQALRYELKDTPYAIKVEESFEGGSCRADVFISHQKRKRNYVIEVKMAGKSGSRDRLPHQISKYHNYVKYLKKIFVFLVVENKRYLPKNNSAIELLIEDLNNKRKTEVIIKPPKDLRY